ncbi:DUF317 domain-containing protein [Kitasatospora sp. NPDC088783]|uniref:DUF317 domain-containing protein n=1 Tax=Kitasatospora sp. NPDC088783 TaxID=3364077 RepID=UPI00381C20A4
MTPDTPVTVTPGHLAGPGDPDAAFGQFFETNETWQRWRSRDKSTIAVHEQLTARIELDHEAGDDDPRWTIAAYTSPVGELHWQAQFCVRTPVEIVMAVADQLTYLLDHPSGGRRDALLWEGRPLGAAVGLALHTGQRATAPDRPSDAPREAPPRKEHSPDAAARLARLETDPAWRETGLGSGFTRTDGTGGIHLPVQGPGSTAAVPGAVVWGGPRGYEHLRWRAEFTAECPNSLVIAALNEVIEPQPAERLLGQVPAANMTQVRIGARPARPAAATAHGHHRPTGSNPPSPTPADPAPPGGEHRRR